MEELLNLIQIGLRDLVDKRHGGNISKAAHAMKTDYHLVYKGYHGSLKGVVFFQAYDILRHTVPDKWKEILGEFFPDNMKALMQIAESGNGDPMEVLNRKLSVALENRISYAIFVMADCGSLTRDIVQSTFGSIGLSELDKLLAAEVLTSNGESINTTIHGHLSPEGHFPRLAVERQIASLSLGRSGTSIVAHHGALSEVGIKKAYAVVTESTEKLKAIFADEHNQGDTLFFAASYCGPADLGEG